MSRSRPKTFPNHRIMPHFPTISFQHLHCLRKTYTCARWFGHRDVRFLQPVPQRRQLSSTGKTRQHVAPTMEQLRAPFAHKNNSILLVLLTRALARADWCSYYTLSVILGTVALSYGSVPMYKMVRFAFLVLRSVSFILSNRSVSRLAGEASPSKLLYTRTPMTLLLGLRP